MRARPMTKQMWCCGTLTIDSLFLKWYITDGLEGGMAEWFKAAVLKTVVRKYRGFESYFLRQQYANTNRGELTE